MQAEQVAQQLRNMQLQGIQRKLEQVECAPSEVKTNSVYDLHAGRASCTAARQHAAARGPAQCAWSSASAAGITASLPRVQVFQASVTFVVIAGCLLSIEIVQYCAVQASTAIITAGGLMSTVAVITSSVLLSGIVEAMAVIITNGCLGAAALKSSISVRRCSGKHCHRHYWLLVVQHNDSGN